jgi:putative effector of murein hydrolase LrgA (UPF0299 family)
MNSLLATGHLPLLLLVVGLFFPRLTLFFAWFVSAYPPNALSVLLNFVLWLFVPRFLIAYFVYTDLGTNNFWFWAYAITGVLGLFGETGVVHRRTVRRRRVTRRGDRVVEEEEI